MLNLLILIKSKTFQYVSLLLISIVLLLYAYKSVYNQGYRDGTQEADQGYRIEVNRAISKIQDDNKAQAIKEQEAKILVEKEKNKLKEKIKKDALTLQEIKNKNKELYDQLDKICIISEEEKEFLNNK